MTLRLPRLRPDQTAIMQHPAKVKCIAAGRRWGKSFLCGDIALACAAQGAIVGWVAPTYKNSIPLWRWMQPFLAPLRQAHLVHTNKTEMTIEFQGGGMVGVFSGDNVDAVRSWAFHVLMIDEAARMKEDAWQETLQPTLADYDGKAYLISTPKGRNWFWREFQAADGAHQARWHATSKDNPNPRIKEAYARAKVRLPERVFLQEWDAEFLEDAGVVFRRVREAATAQPQTHGNLDHQYVVGVDFAKHEDFTCIAVIDLTENALVYLDRFNQIDYHLQLNRIRAVHYAFQPEAIIAEVNSMGEPLIEMLQRDNVPVIPFRTTNASKAAAIEALQLAFEQGTLRIIDDPVLLDELQSFSQDRLPSGMMRYGAPAGLHDDTVMSLAFAWHGAERSVGNWEFVA